MTWRLNPLNGRVLMGAVALPSRPRVRVSRSGALVNWRAFVLGGALVPLAAVSCAPTPVGPVEWVGEYAAHYHLWRLEVDARGNVRSEAVLRPDPNAWPVGISHEMYNRAFWTLGPAWGRPLVASRGTVDVYVSALDTGEWEWFGSLPEGVALPHSRVWSPDGDKVLISTVSHGPEQAERQYIFIRDGTRWQRAVELAPSGRVLLGSQATSVAWDADSQGLTLLYSGVGAEGRDARWLARWIAPDGKFTVKPTVPKITAFGPAGDGARE